MSSVDQALATQLANIQKKTGKTLEQLAAALRASGLDKHGQLRDFAKAEFGLGHGDANTLVHVVLKPAATATAPAADAGGDAVLDEIYGGPKAALRPIHDAVMARLAGFGAFEVAPKKGYVSLRRKKQFAMLGPATNTRVELGLNHKSLPANPRLLAQPAGGMCQYKVRLVDAKEVDEDLFAWLRAAFDAAG